MCVEFHVYVCVLVFLREKDKEKPQESCVRQLEVEEEMALRQGGGANTQHPVHRRAVFVVAARRSSVEAF